LFQPPATGNGNGDPHFSTMDGTSYTFNPVGEFTYLKAADDTIQTRIAQYADSVGNKKLASYFSAFAIKSGQSDTVQVELSSAGQFFFRVNGQTMTLDPGFWSFNGISLDYINTTSVIVQTTSAITLEIHIIGGVLGAIVSLPGSAKGHVSGLVGNWDDNRDNDFQTPDGTIIPSTSNPADIHDKFGLAWSTTVATSLFTYPTNLAWSDYQDRSFRPTFSVPSTNPACNGDTDCNYDASITGDLNVGLSNIAVKQRAAAIEQINEDVAKYCPATVGVANGQVTVQESGSTVSYSVACDKGFKLDGKKTVTCADGVYEALGVCASGFRTSPMTSAMMAVVIVASLLRQLMQHG
jgi:hypothetical protein